MDMDIIELYKAPKNTIWNDSKTVLCVFDYNGKEIADYDFSTGLKIMQDNHFMTVYITNKDLVPGSWKFMGSIINNNDGVLTQSSVEVDGEKSGVPFDRTYEDQDPWNNTRIGGKYVSAQVREERMNLCRSCPLFIAQEGICSITGLFVIESTKIESSYCPEEKWGVKYIQEENVAEEKIQEEQQEFEKELDEFLQGLGG